MDLFGWFKRTSTPAELLKRRKDREFIEALRHMEFSCEDGRLTNHGLSEYGAEELYKSGREPNAVEQIVVLADGSEISYKSWKEVRMSKETI